MLASRALVFACCGALALSCGPVTEAPEKGAAAAGAPGSETTTPSATPMPNDPTARPTPKISFEDIATYPLPGTVVPGALAFAPGGEKLTWLHTEDGSLNRQLYAYDLESGTTELLVKPPGGGVKESELSLEEKLRRERARSRALGITRYAWPKTGDRLLLPIAGDIWTQDGLHGELRQLLDRKAWCEKNGCDPSKPAIDVKMSRDGSLVSFVHDVEVFVMPADGSAPPRQLTRGARGTGKTNGLAEYIAQEEMGRSTGYWLSPDAAQLAFVEVDETHIPTYRIVHQGSEGTGAGHQEDHAYPFAGAANAKVRLGVVSTRGGQTRWMKLDIPPDGYLARVAWMADGRLAAQVENREQSELKLIALDPKSGQATPLLTEKSEVWINLHRLLRPLRFEAEADPGELDGAFVWGSEKTGFMHLYLHGPDGKELRALTRGDWMVESIVALDTAKKKLWFTGTKEGPLERHLYEVGLDGEGLRRVTTTPGMHGIVMDPEHERFVDIVSGPDTPPTLTLRKVADGAEIRRLFAAEDPRIEKLDLTPPKLVTLDNRAGTQLHGAIYAPDPEVYGPGPYPTLVSVYGGPHAQRVSHTWGMTVDMRAQALRDRGYLVFKLDNRGSARRGLAFEGAIKHDMGNLEVQDQVDGVAWLVDQKLADPERVGIYGWSYGGYMSAMALARAPETFSLAVAGAPVTHWDGYDTHYTERYMGTPQTNPEGYARSSVMAHVEKLQGELMLVHGLIDENVHFRHTARLIQALIEARKDYELLLFPAERHMPRKLEDRVYMEQRIFAFIDAHFG